MTTKKNLLPGEYIPPRLVRSSEGWYIIYYHIENGRWVRKRNTFNLNRIPDKKRRLERAREFMASLDQKLADPDVSTEHSFISNLLAETPIIQAIDLAVNLKLQSPKKETRKSFSMIRKMLVAFVEKKKWQKMKIVEFTGRHAQAFLDDCLLRNISNTTFNNYRGFSTIIFNTLINREYISVNPFHKIPKRENEEKHRRAFTADERRIVLEHVYQTDYWLFILILLHYQGLLRRTECYRLRFSNFNLKDGYIELAKSVTKNKKAAVITIPDAIMPYLTDIRFVEYPTNYLIFGKGCRPHPTLSAGDTTYKERHRKMLLLLQKEKKLGDISGLSLYSWKDTGMTELAKILRPVELRDHARHASIDQSLTYYHKDKLIENVKKAKI